MLVIALYKLLLSLFARGYIGKRNNKYS